MLHMSNIINDKSRIMRYTPLIECQYYLTYYLEITLPQAISTLPTVPRQVIKTIGKAIAIARHQKHWSQSELAERLDTTRQKVARLEKGDHRIDVGTLITASWLLNIPLIHGIDFSATKTKDFLSLLISVLDEQLKKNDITKENPNYENF
jgi:transcriptional regulator with XRE-family HTH domain